jgi:hypothetical protein
MPDTVAEKLANQKDCHIFAGVPRAEHPAYKFPGDPRPLRPPGNRHALPDRPTSH